MEPEEKGSAFASPEASRFWAMLSMGYAVMAFLLNLIVWTRLGL
jgi:hypothetical protein